MHPNTRTLLEDMLHRCERIGSHVHNITLDEYLTNDLIRDAVERNFIALGEMVGRLSKDDPDILHQITAHQEIVGLRNRIAHGYDAEINDSIIWLTIHQSVPVLRTELGFLLSSDD